MNAVDFSGKIITELENSKSDMVTKNAVEALGRMKSKKRCFRDMRKSGFKKSRDKACRRGGAWRNKSL
jgi:hypothetical protein